MPFQVCRVCYRTGHDFLSLDKNANSYSKKFAACVPEIDIYIINNPGLCGKCVEMLNVAYEFRETCLKNEKRFNTFSRGEGPSNITQASSVNNVPPKNKSETVSIEAVFQSAENVPAVDSEDVSNPPINPKLFCEICVEELPSEYDKNVHDYKLHRKLRYMKKFASFLTPTVTKPKEISSIILLDVELDEPINKKDSANCNNNNNTNADEITENNSHNIIENQSYECRKCNVTFKDTCELEWHNLIHLPNLCQICGKTFNTRISLENHMKLHTTVCCGESFTTPTLLQLHTYKEHNNTCGICNEVFDQISVLFHHLLNHLGELSYKCNSCRKQFKSKIYLDTHLCNSVNISDSLQLKNSQVKCLQCNITFQSRGEFIRHSHSQYNIRKKYINPLEGIKCTRCDLLFETRKIFLQHLYKEHSTKKKLETEKTTTLHKYNCQICYEEFELHTELQQHVMEIHCVKQLKVSVSDCRKDIFYRDQEALHIDFTIPPVHQIENFAILKEELSNRSKRICFFCRLMFGDHLELHKHLQHTHQNCCAQKIENLEMLIEHNFIHYKQIEELGIHDEITCLQCFNVYRNYQSILSHSCHKRGFSWSQIEISAEDIISEQSLCTIETYELDTDDEEVAVVNCEEPVYIKCDICNTKFDCKNTLLIHIRLTHL